MARAIVVVLDGFGVGAMADVPVVRPEDAGAHTLLRLAREVGPLRLLNLERLGLGRLVEGGLETTGRQVSGRWGRCNLTHVWADTYAGHNEIMGNRPKRPAQLFMREAAPALAEALRSLGHQVRTAGPDLPCLVVDEAMLVHDNFEADPGTIINVTGCLNVATQEQVLQVGREVRQRVPVSRVIALGNVRLKPERLFGAVGSNDKGQCGIYTPELAIYDDLYWVRHLGYGVDPEGQVPLRAVRAGLPVALLGKMADVINCPGADARPGVPTPWVMGEIVAAMDRQEAGLIAATVQETDLAGHESDSVRFVHVLQQADEGIGEILSRMRPDDLLLVTADHGNDPRVNPGRHTREQVPLLLGGLRVQAGHFPDVPTTAAVGATAAAWLGVGPTEAGEPVPVA